MTPRDSYADILSSKIGLPVRYCRHACTEKWRGSYDVGFMIGGYTVALGNTFGEHGERTNEIFRHYESVEKALIEKLQSKTEHAARFSDNEHYAEKGRFFNELLEKLGGMTVKRKLKLCPFCGGSVVMNRNVGHKLADGTPYSFITCNKCNISLALSHSHNADKITEEWNSRVQEARSIEKVR